MPVHGPVGLSLRDHERLSHGLLTARAHLARVRATVHGDGAWSWSRPVLATLASAIRELDRVRDELSAVIPLEHAIVHPALGRRIYFPTVDHDGSEEVGSCP